jgi:glycerophosphoryl diester phosphodiesterase
MSSPVLLIHHAATRGRLYPPNSIRGLRACLDAGAQVIEMDISPLADGDFALLHGPLLEPDTTGFGPVDAHTADEVSSLRHVWRGDVTDEPVRLLGQALELVRRQPHPVELQLDLKPHAPLTDAVLSSLVVALQPVKDQVRVTSGADWALRRLRALDADLPLGFDPLLYFEAPSEEVRDPGLPPFRRGAYGYWDDHPLASRRWGRTADYLAARAEALWAQAPTGAIWYISARLLAQALDDGFDWIADLHCCGAQLDTWTLNAGRPGDVELAWRLAAAGVDRITTDDPPALVQALLAEHPHSAFSVEY